MGRTRRLLVRLGECGNATIEFALIASVYMIMILAAFEMGYMLFIQASLDNASRDAARLIRTGQAQVASDPQSTFQTLLCNEVSNVIPCASLIYSVQDFTSWTSADSSFTSSPARNSKGQLENPSFNAGSAGDIMVVQVTYNYPFLTPWIGKLLGNGGTAFLVSTVVFQNEPYNDNL